MAIYFKYFLQFLKSKLAYRWNFAAAVLSNLFVAITGMLFVVFLIDGRQVQELQGWSRAEVLFIFGMATVSTALFGTLSVNLYSFGDRYILKGQFDRVLLRPLNSLSQVMFESFNLDSIGSLLAGIATLVYACNKLAISFSFFDFVWLTLACFSGAVILLSVFVVLASASFHFEDRFGIAPPFYNLMAFGRYPLPIFNRVIQFILTAVVPFAFVGFYPATHFFEREGFEVFCYSTPLVAFLSIFVAWKFWQFGVSRYESAGS
jgi:ABC-2 type transport system permease protein